MAYIPPMLSEAEGALLDAVRELLPNGTSVELETDEHHVLLFKVKLRFGAFVPVSGSLINDVAMHPSISQEISGRMKELLAGAMREFLERLDA